MNTVGPSKEEAAIEGTAPGLDVEEIGNGLVANGTDAPVTIASSPDGGFSVEIPEVQEFESCGAGEGTKSTSNEEPEELGSSEEGEGCTGPADSKAEGEETLMPITITPIGIEGDATNPGVVDGNAVVSGNTASQVDTALRPLSDGGMTFQSIRDDSAPEEYSWNVELGDEQVLRLIDDQHAAVYYNDRTPAFSITAVPAHDAEGTPVPTSLTVSKGSVVTLRVAFKAGNQGAPFLYPIIAGTGWEGGFRTIHVDLDNKPPGEEEEGVYSTDNAAVQIATYGPPLAEGHPPAMTQLDSASLSQLGNNYEAEKRKFKFTYCKPHEIPNTNGVTPPVTGWGTKRPGENLPKVVSDCSNPDLEGIYWAVSAHGWFHYVVHQWEWVTGFSSDWCEKRGEEREQMAKVHCKLVKNESGHGPAGAVRGPIEIFGQYRFASEGGHWGFAALRAVCFTEGGILYPRYTQNVTEPFERPMIWEYSTVHVTQSCNWG